MDIELMNIIQEPTMSSKSNSVADSLLDSFQFYKFVFLVSTIIELLLISLGILGPLTVLGWIGFGALIAISILLLMKRITPFYMFLLCAVANIMCIFDHSNDKLWVVGLYGFTTVLCGWMAWFMRNEPTERELLSQIKDK